MRRYSEPVPVMIVMRVLEGVGWSKIKSHGISTGS
jgi:hypothetical protein